MNASCMLASRLVNNGVVDWKERLRELVLAGGAFGLSACSGAGAMGGNPGGNPGIPCGNGNPDPCICGRPESSATLAMQCDQEMACQANGGVWDPFYVGGPGSVIMSSPHCNLQDGGSAADGDAADAAVDASAASDGSADGSAD